ncbi:hypothetical protein ANCDUO_12426 [Ancylostoma duodenale]|uniref:Uncharacterized protein n=1 Tax=Ancylostoma duodenale TaxID=51022 RepID=A0A0C2D5L7_9BILA|nr:hypothetical protein ANCDUO_12426 [Ancylostoma duodenale]
MCNDNVEIFTQAGTLFGNHISCQCRQHLQRLYFVPPGIPRTPVDPGRPGRPFSPFGPAGPGSPGGPGGPAGPAT